MAEKKFIEVDAFAEAICNFQHIDENAANNMIWLLRTFPTADVEEVRHGKWVDDIFGAGNMICSECEQYPADDEDGNPLSALADWQPERCPNCGAKMDLE